MTICVHTVKELRNLVSENKKLGKSVGLVPTMGALHEGHGSLIKTSSSENDFTVVSVFVNPTQFGPNEDFNAYPRTLDKDLILAKEFGADVVFAPSAAEMYPSSSDTWIEVTGHVTEVLCGRSRPIHFRGVTTVVGKLFNIVCPNRAYFGQKDAQQVEVLSRMVKDLFFDIELRIVRISREETGLARSSRNSYLSKDEKDAAVVLSKALKNAQDLFAKGERSVSKIISATENFISKEPLAKIEYIECYGLPELYELKNDTLVSPTLLATAVRFGKTRLIDNTILE